MRKYSKDLILLLVVVLAISCKSDEVNPENNQVDPDNFTAACGLATVYRNSQGKSSTTIYIKTGYGSDKVEYRELSDSSLVYYTTFVYNDQDQVTLSRRFDVDDVLESEETIEYWPNGKRKKVKTERKKLETLSDKTNTTQESIFDENGNIKEYRNMTNSGTLVNHHLYTNTYDGDLLVKVFRDDQMYSYDAISEYSYNADGTLNEFISKDIDGNITGRTEYKYSDEVAEVLSYNSSGTLIRTEKTFRNKNKVILKTQSLQGNGNVDIEHFYSYNCSK